MQSMENRLVPLMISWAGFLGFIAFSIAYMERFSYNAGIPWLLQLLRLAFVMTGSVLLLRFLSFRAQRPWEKLKSAYAQTSGIEPAIRVAPNHGGVNLALFLGWILSGVAALILGLPHILEKTGWQATQVLDLAAWFFAWIWAAKVSWLRAARSRETLKMSLDDLRSKRGHASSPIREYKPGTARAKTLFAFLFLGGLGALLATAAWRLSGAAGNAAKVSVADCMDQSWRNATAAFEKQGQPPTAQTPDCAPDSAQYQWDVSQDESGITLSAWESEQADPFRDGWNGNQGLRLVPEGRWVEVERPKRHETGKAAPPP
jgi:hypothetical protein